MYVRLITRKSVPNEYISVDRPISDMADMKLATRLNETGKMDTPLSARKYSLVVFCLPPVKR